MKIFSAAQTRLLDAETLAEENIPSHALMERAATQFTNRLLEKYAPLPDIYVFCGTGNNGGDGLSIARQLHLKNTNVIVYVVGNIASASEDFLLNYKKAKDLSLAIHVYDGHTFPHAGSNDIIIDAIFGSGLNRPVTGLFKEAIEKINLSTAIKIAVDVPSGFFCDSPTLSVCIRADYTLSFEFPKLGFFFPENYQFTGNWEVLSIGLSKTSIDKTKEIALYMQGDDIKKLIKVRKKFDHKGIFGSSLIIAGNYGMEGAAALSGKACLVAGSGLVTLCSENRQWFYPEIMYLSPTDMLAALKLKKYQVLAIGPGLGKHTEAQQMIALAIQNFDAPIVLDADALNMLAENKHLLKAIPANSILTPHPKEFERLFGVTKNAFELLALQIEMSVKLQCIIVYKRAYTCITSPDGDVYFNSTGNPGMATAGSGDVLTGIITALLAQKYIPLHAALLGVFLHGFAGDLAMQKTDGQNIIATDIIDHVQSAYKALLEN
jgi:NAD(P)H-hydrate epimerase